MKMYSNQDVVDIVQDFLAKHFNFDYVSLNGESYSELKIICEDYGIEVENIGSNYGT